MTVVKNWGSQHSKDLRRYEITPEGLIVDGAVPAFRGLRTGHPDPKFIAPPGRGRASRPRRSDQE